MHVRASVHASAHIDYMRAARCVCLDVSILCIYGYHPWFARQDQGDCWEILLTNVTVQVSIPLWALVHLPVVVTITTAVFTPKGWLHCILYVLFENAMGIVKLGAVLAGDPPSSLPSYPPSTTILAFHSMSTGVCVHAFKLAMSLVGHLGQRYCASFWLNLLHG